MKLTHKNTQEFETLPDVVTGNDLIQRWHSIYDGTLQHLVVDASAQSAESIQRFWLRVVISLIACWVGGVILKDALSAAAIGITGPEIIAFLFTFLTFGALVIWLSKYRLERRICKVTTGHLFIERWHGTKTYALTQVIGLQCHPINQQKIDEERRQYRKQRDPRLKQPYSTELVLDTELGQVCLGAVFGLEKSRDICNSLNTAIQYMKSRSPASSGAVTDPRFQYRQKTAGRIPD